MGIVKNSRKFQGVFEPQTWHDAYKIFRARYPKHRLSEKDYGKMLSQFNEALVNRLIQQGGQFYLGHQIGHLHVGRYKRYFKNMQKNIDWHASKKATKENGGVWTPIYFTSDWKPMWNFRPRQQSRLMNLEMYNFRCTQGPVGIGRKLWREVNKNELLLWKYTDMSNAWSTNKFQRKPSWASSTAASE